MVPDCGSRAGLRAVGALVGQSEGVWYILDIQRFRASPLEVERRVRQTAEMDGMTTSVYLEQEPGASGVQAIDHLRREVLPGYAVFADRPVGNKPDRARPLASAAEAGNVHLVRGPWVSTFLDEAEAFPYGAHDDQVDAVAGAMRVATRAEAELWVG